MRKNKIGEVEATVFHFFEKLLWLATENVWSGLWSCNSNFGLRLHPWATKFFLRLQLLKLFGSGHPKLLGFRLHSPTFHLLMTSTAVCIE